MTEHIGSVYVDVLPDADQFATRFRAKALPQIDALGRELGARFSQRFTEPLQRDLPEVFRRARPRTNQQSQQSGREAGDAFGRQLDARIGAAIAALPKIDLDADISEAERKLATVRTTMAGLTETRLGIRLSDEEVLSNLAVLKGDLEALTGPTHEIRVRMNATAAVAEISALQAAIAKLDEAPGAGAAAPRPIQRAAQAAEDLQVKLPSLMSMLSALAPAAVPVTAAAAAGTAAVGAFGVVGAAAIKSIADEQKRGTAVGKEYAAGLAQIKGEGQKLESTLAEGLLPAFGNIQDKLVAEAPKAREAVRGLSTEVGSIVEHLVGGGIGGLSTFEPMLEDVLHAADGAAASFERWATGPGGEKFATALKEDFDAVVPVLGDVVDLAQKLIAAGNAPGLVLLRGIDTVVRTLDAFPEGAWEAFIGGFVTLKGMSLISGLFTNWSVKLGYYTRAELEAAAATRQLTAAQQEQALAGNAAAASAARGGARGLLGRGVGVLGKAATGLFVGNLASGFADQATGGWQQSQNNAQFFAGNLAHELHNVFTGNFRGFFSDPRRNVEARQAFADMQRGARAATTNTGGPFGGVANLTYGAPGQNFGTYKTGAPSQLGVGVGSALAGAVGGTAAQLHQLTNAEVTASAAAEQLTSQQRELTAQLNLTRTVAAHQDINQAATAYDNLTQGLQKSVDAQGKWLDQGGKTVITLKGVAVGEKTMRAALAETNGDYPKAIGLIKGRIDALTATQKAAASAATGEKRLTGALTEAETKYSLTADQVAMYAGAVGISANKVADGTVSTREFTDEIGRLNDIIGNGDTAIQGWVAAVTQFNSSADTAASRAELIGAALKASNGDALDYASAINSTATANQQFVTDLKNIKSGVIDLKTGTVDYHNAAAGPLINDLHQIQDANVAAAAAIYQHELSIYGGKKAADDAYRTYRNNTRTQLIDEAERLGYSSKQARGLADQFLTIKNSGDLRKQIELIGEDKVQTALAGILQDLDILAGKTTVLSIEIDAHNRSNAASGRGRGVGSSAGGYRIGAQGMLLDFFAAGGVEDHRPAIYNAQPGTVRVFAEPETEWEAYIPGANDGRRPRAKAITQEVARRLGGVAFFAQGGGEGGGFSGVDFSGNANKYGSTSGSKSSKKKEDPKFDRSALTGFLQQIGITVSAFTQAKNELISALKQAKLSSHELAQVSKEANRLISYSRRIATETDRIQKAQDYLSNAKQAAADVRQQRLGEVSGVQSAFTGLFDVSSAGVRQQVYNDVPAGPVTGAGILADLTKAASQGVSAKADLQKLKGKIPNAVYEQLAMNPGQDTAQIHALATSAPSVLSGIRGQYGRLSSAGLAAGNAVGDQLFGSKIAAADQKVQVAEALLDGFDPKRNPGLAKAVNQLSTTLFGAGKETAKGLQQGLLSEKKHLINTMHEIAHAFEATIRKDLDTHSPSRKAIAISRDWMKGHVQGIVADLPAVRSATRRVAAEFAFDPTQPVSDGSVAPAGGRHYHVHGIEDPAGFTTAVIRREQRLAF